MRRSLFGMLEDRVRRGGFPIQREHRREGQRDVRLWHKADVEFDAEHVRS